MWQQERQRSAGKWWLLGLSGMGEGCDPAAGPVGSRSAGSRSSCCRNCSSFWGGESERVRARAGSAVMLSLPYWAVAAGEGGMLSPSAAGMPGILPHLGYLWESPGRVPGLPPSTTPLHPRALWSETAWKSGSPSPARTPSQRPSSTCSRKATGPRSAALDPGGPALGKFPARGCCAKNENPLQMSVGERCGS